MEKTLALGSIARDKVTGIQGTVTGRVEYVSGVVEYQITGSTTHEGKPVENWFGVNRLEQVESPSTLEPAPR